MTIQEARLKVSFEIFSETFNLIRMGIKGISWHDFKPFSARYSNRAEPDACSEVDTQDRSLVCCLATSFTVADHVCYLNEVNISYQ